MNTTSIVASASGDTTVVAAVAGRRIKVLSYVFVSGGPVNVIFKSGASTSLTGVMTMPTAGYGVSAPGCISSMGFLPQFITASGEALVINLSAATTVGGHLTYEVLD